MDGRVYVETKHEREMQTNVQRLMSFANSIRCAYDTTCAMPTDTRCPSHTLLYALTTYLHNELLVRRTKFRCSSLSSYECK